MTFPHPHSLRTVSMPLGMVVGAMFCRPIAALETASGGMITPSLIFLMLFFTFCRVDVAQYAAATASPLAVDGADRFQRGRLRDSAAVQPDSSARRDDLRADTHRNGPPS